MKKTYRVGILIFDEVEVLDFTGPYEVFSVVRYQAQDYDTIDPTPFSVNLVSENKDIVTCRYGMKVMPDEEINEETKHDIIVVPGGLGARRQINNEKILDWIRAQHEDAELTTSVCTGALLLANAGILKGRKATTHHKSLDRLEEEFEGVTVIRDQRFVDEGDVITSGGISAGIDMSFHVVTKLLGEDISNKTRNYMEY